jgi:hypothetical protein
VRHPLRPGASKDDERLILWCSDTTDIGSANVEMSNEDFDAINKILLEFPKAGDRCPF